MSNETNNKLSTSDRAASSENFSYAIMNFGDELPSETCKLSILTLPGQKVSESLTTGGAAVSDLIFTSEPAGASKFSLSVKTLTGIQNFLRYLFNANEDFIVFSNRPGLIWDIHLADRINAEINFFNSYDGHWLCLSADGLDLDNKSYVSAHFDFEPTLNPDRGRQLIVQSAGTIVVLNMKNYKNLKIERNYSNTMIEFVNDLIILGYIHEMGSFFTGRLFPCFAEHRGLNYRSIQDQIMSFDLRRFFSSVEQQSIFRREDDRMVALSSWIERIGSKYIDHHNFSFVIRTIFRRDYLLDRCLISIEYIRSSLSINVEVVIASDVEKHIAMEEIEKLALKFPKIDFVYADGLQERGYSRVRNLVAGIRKTSGTRVCIIDDDDFYTPQSIASFTEACLFGKEELIIFDTQIAVERWLLGGAKPHRELLAYRDFYPASDWIRTLNGSNSIPLCGVIHPGKFIRTVINDYKFDYDMSEDFIFHLHCFSHPARPTIKTINKIGVYQSHRENSDNVSNVQDRAKWVTDTGNGLYQTLFEVNRTFESIFDAKHFSSSAAARNIDDLRSEVAMANVREMDAVSRLANIIDRSRTAEERMDAASRNQKIEIMRLQIELDAERSFAAESGLDKIRAELEVLREREEHVTRKLAFVLSRIGQVNTQADQLGIDQISEDNVRGDDVHNEIIASNFVANKPDFDSDKALE